MTTCTIIGLIVSCIMAADRPRLTPDQAAAILAPGQYVHVPRSYPLPAPSYPMPVMSGVAAPEPMRRLDGTSYSTPPWTLRAYIGRRLHNAGAGGNWGYPSTYDRGQPIDVYRPRRNVQVQPK